MSVQASQRERSTCNKLHEQNHFHKEKDRYTSLMKRNQNAAIFTTKISRKQVPRKKN